jgi:hypothetical protein
LMLSHCRKAYGPGPSPAGLDTAGARTSPSRLSSH